MILAKIEQRKGKHSPYSFVVKVQAPIFTTDPQCLIFNRSRSILCKAPFEGWLKMMLGDEVKIFCRARIEGSNLRILQRVTNQDW